MTDEDVDVPADVLLPIRYRLSRARELVRALREAEADHLQHAMTTSVHRLSDRSTAVRLNVHAEPPPDLGLRLGEVVHQVRSALDNLVVLLAEHNAGHQLGNEETFRLQFPITYGEKAFQEEIRKGSLAGRSDAQMERVREVQPFSPNVDLGYVLPPHQQPLALLQAASNADKHRRIAVVIQVVRHRAVGVNGRVNVKWGSPPFKDGDDVVVVDAPADQVEPHIDFSLGCEIPDIRVGKTWVEVDPVDLSNFAQILIDRISREVVGHIVGRDFTYAAMHDR